MPLVWSHAEFIKLLIARRDGQPVELLDCVRKRYGRARPAARNTRWRNETPVPTLAIGRTLLIEDRREFALHLGWDGWQDIEELQSEPLPFGLWGVAIDPARYRDRARLDFTAPLRSGMGGARPRRRIRRDAARPHPRPHAPAGRCRRSARRAGADARRRGEASHRPQPPGTGGLSRRPLAAGRPSDDGPYSVSTSI